ncbi:DNA-J related domain-containing protein [Stutzerimonas azotifigens]|uniref:DNA-J related domain-containing protein n=1 Tax=Stutzerimonas azotifigens TaxID=291995 RepID=UPI0004299CBF|nr:DNA-J related domain-containing protein [Stutzerimonas azotifigens]
MELYESQPAGIVATQSRHALARSGDLLEETLELLRAHPDGISEYQLIQALKAQGSPHISQQPLTDKLVLFQTHFKVFNALYRLRDRLRAERAHELMINPLCILLQPYSPTHEEALSRQDPLREYYLDLGQLEETTEEDVENLLSSYWVRNEGGAEKREALVVFGLDRLEHPLTLPIIKHRYRQLVAEHHPDRGGSTEQLQAINQAMEILQRYYGPAASSKSL